MSLNTLLYILLNYDMSQNTFMYWHSLSGLTVFNNTFPQLPKKFFEGSEYTDLYLSYLQNHFYCDVSNKTTKNLFQFDMLPNLTEILKNSDISVETFELLIKNLHTINNNPELIEKYYYIGSSTFEFFYSLIQLMFLTDICDNIGISFISSHPEEQTLFLEFQEILDEILRTHIVYLEKCHLNKVNSSNIDCNILEIYNERLNVNKNIIREYMLSSYKLFDLLEKVENLNIRWIHWQELTVDLENINRINTNLENFIDILKEYYSTEIDNEFWNMKELETKVLNMKLQKGFEIKETDFLLVRQ